MKTQPDQPQAPHNARIWATPVSQTTPKSYLAHPLRRDRNGTPRLNYPAKLSHETEKQKTIWRDA